MEIEIKTATVTWLLALTTVFLVLTHIAGQYYLFFVSPGIAPTVVGLFNLDGERNVPAAYSTLLLLACACLLMLIAHASRRKGAGYLYWLGLALVFVFLASDEFFELHEGLVVPVRSALKTSGLLYFAWVIPYSAALGILALIYLKFVFSLPARTRRLFLLAGLIYVAGTLGMELFAGQYYEQVQRVDAVYSLIFVTIEELLEMTGLVIFIHALLSHIDAELGEISL
ncbi:MAG: hypothetical protein A2150_04130 [Candidatus Muproteobacteria bacterium RBG_16_64_11]|uniref:Uncharacterized protein n=1 Tax=Candidatus Muproteobacteria bacterium RBG_16_64_11 TaxID=1817758 RepID=A0A1F6TD41_9PROT|nr:MAG: hypothetical protein A2150_04130 [Candidatus Muproteobacteria bacterium RBG_16_64_11]